MKQDCIHSLKNDYSNCCCNTFAVMVNYFVAWFGWAMNFSVSC